MIALPHNGFFDESGTHDDSEIIAVSGLISSYDGWSGWELEWNKILKSRGVKVFHFSEFMARKGEFENDWTNEQRNEFMERLRITVSDNIVIGIATSVFKDNYEQFAPQDLREQLKHPYYFGLYTCLYQVLTMEQIVKRVKLPKPIRFLFDRKKGYEGFAAAIYYNIKEQFEKLGWDTGFGDMGFGSKDNDIPLQAADLLVGVTARNRLRSRNKGLSFEETMEKSLRTLGDSGRLLIADAGQVELEHFVRIFRP
jgi:hypothetical protein